MGFECEMFMNLGYLTQVIKITLGQAGAEALCDAVNYYLTYADNDEFGSWEDQILLYALLFCFDCNGLNTALPAFDALRDRKRLFTNFVPYPDPKE